MQVEAQRLDDLRLRALEGRIEAGLELGEGPELVTELEGAVAEHPYRETLWRHLMLALYRADRQKEALDAYRRAHDLLTTELGLEPGAELKRLQQEILRQEVAPPTPPSRRSTIPAPASTFFGRGEELAALERLLEDSRLVTLTGVGGVGKTRLAIEAARQALPDFPEAVFVDLSSLSQPAGVVRRLATALDVREHTDVPLEQQIATRLGGAGLLLVLDNCEHLREACAVMVGGLVPRCPALHVLATSRGSLGCEGETEYAVAPLDVGDAVDLFLARAQAVRPRLTDDDQNRATAAAICSDLDGLPLAIELAAARARALSVDEIAERLADRFRFLVSWRRLTPARHRTLEQAMAWSYDLMPEEEQRLLARLSVFAGGFTLAAAAAVASEADEDTALPHIERLVDASLVVAEEHAGQTRYRLLETIRQYGAQRLRERDEPEDLRKQHADYIASLLQTHQTRAQGNLGQWIEAVRPEYDNILAALVWSRERGTPNDQLRLSELTWRLWWVRGDFGEGREWLETAIERGTDADRALRARALEGAAGLAWAHGDDDRAAGHAEEAQRLYAQVADERGELATSTILGHVSINRGLYDVARRHFERTRVLAERRISQGLEQRGRTELALAVLNLGSTAHMAGDEERAARLYEEAGERYRALGDRYGVALSRHLSGVLAADVGRYDDAAACVRDALPVFVELSFAQYTWQCIETAAAVARARGAGDECARLLGAASRLREGAGTPPAPWERAPARERAAAEAAMGAGAFAAAWQEGRSLTKSDAVERALHVVAH